MASLIFLISLAVNLVRGPESVFSPIFSNLLQIYILIFTKNIFLFTKVNIVLLYQLTTNTNTMKEKLMQQLKDLHFEAWSTSFDVLHKVPGAAEKYSDICHLIDTLHFKLLEESHIVHLTNNVS